MARHEHDCASASASLTSRQSVFDVHGVGRGGAPDIDGVLPGANVAKTASVVPEGIPDEMDCRAGMPGGAVGRLLGTGGGAAPVAPEDVGAAAETELEVDEDAADDDEEVLEELEELEELDDEDDET